MRPAGRRNDDNTPFKVWTPRGLRRAVWSCLVEVEIVVSAGAVVFRVGRDVSEIGAQHRGLVRGWNGQQDRATIITF